MSLDCSPGILDNGGRLQRTSSIPTGYPVTVTFWTNVRQAAVNATFIDYGTSVNYWALYINASQKWSVFDAIATTVSATTVAENTWIHVGFVVDNAAGNVKLYLNGALDTTSTGLAALTLTNFTLMNDHFSGTVGVKGRIGAIKSWTAALTLAEIQSEMRMTHPQRFANLEGWWPAWRQDRMEDYSGNGRTWTLTEPIDDYTHPPVSWGAPPHMPQLVGAGGALPEAWGQYRRRRVA